MNNSNFGNDCQNNMDSCDFRPMFDNIEEIAYIQTYTSLFFNDDYKDFACLETIKQQIEHEYNSEIMGLSPNDPCFEAKKYSIGQKHSFKIDAVDSMIARKKEKKFKHSEQKQTNIYKIQIQKRLLISTVNLLLV